MKRATIAIVFALLVVMLPIWAQGPETPPPPQPPAPGVMPPPPGGGMPGMGMMMYNPLMAVRVPQGPMLDRMVTELNLSEDQNTKLQAAFKRYDEKSQPLMTQYQDSVRDMQSALREQQLDTAKVKAASVQALKAEESLISASLDFWSGFKSILTTEQNQKLSQIMPAGPRAGFGGQGQRPGGARSNRTPPGGWQRPNRNQGQQPPAPAPPAPGAE